MNSTDTCILRDALLDFSQRQVNEAAQIEKSNSGAQARGLVKAKLLVADRAREMAAIQIAKLQK